MTFSNRNITEVVLLELFSKESCHAQTSNKQAVTVPITDAAIYVLIPVQYCTNMLIPIRTYTKG